MYPVIENQINFKYSQRIEAAPDVVFPLLCPVREAEWLEDWQYEILHSRSGVAEVGCVFRTALDMVWIVVKHDPLDRVVEFARVKNDLLASRLIIQVEPTPDGFCECHVHYSWTPISEAGQTLAAEDLEESKLLEDTAWWVESLNYFLKTGDVRKKPI